MDVAMPEYESAVSVKNSQKILEAIASEGGVANFSRIEHLSGVRGSVLNHHLNRLRNLNVIEKEGRGTYLFKYKSPLCFIFETRTCTPIAYFGLLGKRETRETPEPKVALELLTKEGIKPNLIYIVTSPEALDTWKPLKLPYHWILCYEEEIVDVDAIKRKVTPQLLSLLRSHIVIMDCTSATKPATIAYYELSQELWMPLIYVYEETNQLKWLISRQTMLDKLKKQVR